jgi:hypothetical protein
VQHYDRFDRAQQSALVGAASSPLRSERRDSVHALIEVQAQSSNKNDLSTVALDAKEAT